MNSSHWHSSKLSLIDDDAGPKNLSYSSHERPEAPDRSRFDAVTDARTINLTADESGLLEHLEVLRDGRLGERKLVHEVPADAGRPVHKYPENPYSGRMRDSLSQHRELLIGLATLDRAQVRLVA